MVAHGLQAYYADLRQSGSTLAWRDQRLDFDSLDTLIGTPELLALGRR